MAQGIIVKIWNISASSGTRSAAAQISDSISYIENPEKASAKVLSEGSLQVGNQLSYVMNDIKTINGLLVGGRHISDFHNATKEMMDIKEFYGKTDGRVATHGVISLDENESGIENAGKLMLLLDDLMKDVFPNYQVVYAVHTNTENLHVHFIINTVGLDGKKIHMDKGFMRQVFEPAVNKYAIKYGFTPNMEWTKTPKRDAMSIKDRKIILRNYIDDAIEQTDEVDAFIAYLRNKGLKVNVGKHISLQMDGMDKAMRTYQLGKDYSLEAIIKRMSEKQEPLIWKSVNVKAHYLTPRELCNFTPPKMKSYKEMSHREKTEAIKLLKVGRNPWMESKKGNWQIENMNQKLTEISYVYELVHYYSNGTDDINSALKEIIQKRKDLSLERADIRANLKRNNLMIKKYEELKPYMVKAYLYDMYGVEKYKSDFEQYQEIAKSLEKIYGKSVEEVAEFVADQKEQLIYAKAQEKELSTQYKMIVQYRDSQLFREQKEKLSLYDAIGHGVAIRQTKVYGIYESEIKYIYSSKSDYAIRVTTTPDVINGKPTVTTTITVMDKEKNEIEKVCSADTTYSEFNKRIRELEKDYQMYDCSSSKKTKGISR